jgi:hypothetical protein
MEIAIRTILWVHVLAGTLALVVAPIALLTAKGGFAHRRWGEVYFWSMAVVAASAIVVGYWRSILFLMLTPRSSASTRPSPATGSSTGSGPISASAPALWIG